MRKILLKYIIIILILNIENMYSDNFDFTPERMVTDFNGVVYNGTNVLAYGDYGIITFSNDRGESWRQLNIGDQYNIKKMISLDNDFYGIADYSLMKSTDNGMTWMMTENIDDSKFVSFTISNNSIYILTTKSLLKADLNCTIENEPLIELESLQNYTEISSNSWNIYMLSDNSKLEQKHILKYDIATEKSSKLFLNIISEFTTAKYTVSNLMLLDDNLYYANYMQFDSTKPYTVGSYSLMKSTDNGESWFRIHHSMSSVYILKPEEILNLTYTKSMIALMRAIRTSDKDSSYIEHCITDTTSKPERLQSMSYTTMKELIQISEDTLIAVGANKSIITSYDRGIKWNLKSNLNWATRFNDIDYYTENKPPIFLSKNLIFNANRYKSSDGGVTWLPPLSAGVDTNSNLASDYYYFDIDGTGFTVDNRGTHLLTLATKDFGDSYVRKDNIPQLQSNNPKVYNPCININDHILSVNYTSPANLSYIQIFDKNGDLINSSRIDSTRFLNIVKDKNSNLYTFGVYQPEGFERGDLWNCQILKSSDNGISWEKILTDIQLNTLRYGTYYSKPIKNVFIYKDLILMPDIYSTPTKVYSYDIEKQVLDSTELPFYLSRNEATLFTFQDDLYAISNDNTIYRTSNFGSKNAVWDSVHISKYLHGWSDYVPNSGIANRDMIYYAWADDEQIYLVTVRSTLAYVGTARLVLLKPNYVRLYKQEPVSVIEETETVKNYLWNDKPYPIPAINELRTLIYWDASTDIDNYDITVYDMSGIKVAGKDKISIERQTGYSGNLIWDCSTVPAGVYLINISNSTESKTIKAIVTK